MMVVLVRLGVLLVGMMMMLLLLPSAPRVGAAAAAQKGQVRPSHLEGDEGKEMGRFCVSGCTMDKAVVVLCDQQGRDEFE